MKLSTTLSQIHLHTHIKAEEAIASGRNRHAGACHTTHKFAGDNLVRHISINAQALLELVPPMPTPTVGEAEWMAKLHPKPALG